MRSKTTNTKLFFLSILFILVFIGKGFSQTHTYNCYLKNIVYTDCKTMEFEVWIEWTGTNTQKFVFFQAGIDFDYNGMSNGGIITGSFISGTADPSLPISQQNPNWNINSTSKQIRMFAAIATPSSIAFTCPPSPGMRLGKFRMSNTANFAGLSTPNFEWSFTPGTNITTQTKVAFYLGGSTLGTDVTNQAGHIVEDNPPVDINCSGTCPIAATLVQYVPPTCLGGSNGSAIVSITNGVNTSSGTYSLDGGPGIPFQTNPFEVKNLTAGYHYVVASTTAPCVSNAIDFTIEEGLDPDDQNPCTVDACDSIIGIYHTDVDIDDNDACTVDACDQIKGISHTEVRPILSIFANAIACYGETTCIFVQASGDFPPYDGTGIFCGYGKGSYSFDITDSRGCVTTTAPLEITEPLKLTTTISTTGSSGLPDGTATIVVDGGTPEYSYLWSQGGQTTATATGLTPGNYCVQVTDLYGCTATSCVNVYVVDNCDLHAPGTINGPKGVCKKQTGIVYCVTAPPLYADSYVWTLPAGASAVGATNGPCITLKFSSKYKGGFICAKANLWCGTTANACINVVLLTKKPNTPGIISGPNSLCANQTSIFSIAAVPNASSYIWKVDGKISILSGQGTTSITVKTASDFNGGHVKVQAKNCVDVSGTKTLSVFKNPGCRVSASEAADKIENVSENISAYPNPTTGILTVSLQTKTKTSATLKLIDLIGNVVLRDFMLSDENKNTKDLDLTHLKHGMYFLSIEREGVKSETMRIVVE